ncbi:hypothetical protein [Spirosoma sp. KUDC1026]|uniref:hypothetical protein n=1 Tax=Spirosoma sp. KUDC1026 TaxID=2745947 RepID=UPI00159BC8CF|nr:hypothetical protein [Spirosoma sp. KUDC1026]QKZ11166.1 hypothetical protein HU175_00320 [Spirosoma sp. KUDC1026]
MRLSLRLLFFLLSIGFAACKNTDKADPTPVCQLLSTTDQLVETSGRLTDELIRTFTYSANAVTAIGEKSANKEALFRLMSTNQRVAEAVNGQDVITLSYGTSTTQPVSATFSRSDAVQSTFVLEYNATGALTRVVESRRVLPANSLTTERAYSFTYDNAGNLTLERARFTLRTGVVSEQETEYVFDTHASVYANFSARPLLTIIALTQAVETKPGRFWHTRAPLSFQTFDLTTAGTRSTMREATTYIPTYDGNGSLTTQEQTALLYQSSVPTPTTKKNRQVFTYQCN